MANIHPVKKEGAFPSFFMLSLLLQESSCKTYLQGGSPGSISYREEMDKRRAKNLLVFGIQKFEKLHERGKPLLKPHAPKEVAATT